MATSICRRPDVEECDALGADTARCDRDCTWATCGDGHVNAAAGEVCDDGNTVDGDGCGGLCDSDETCGNRIVDTRLPNNRADNPAVCRDATALGTNCAEVCDDGNNVSGDGCSANCLSEEACGNGIRDRLGNPTGTPPSPPEVCDDGNQNDFDQCASDCSSETAGFCGDGQVDPSLEQCDNGQPGVNTASCDHDCTIPVCGDGLLNQAADEDSTRRPAP